MQRNPVYFLRIFFISFRCTYLAHRFCIFCITVRIDSFHSRNSPMLAFVNVIANHSFNTLFFLLPHHLLLLRRCIFILSVINVFLLFCSRRLYFSISSVYQHRKSLLMECNGISQAKIM